MNKDNLQYAFEVQQSINDRNTDIIGTLTSEISGLRSEIQEKKNTIAALGATNRKLKIENDKYKQIEKATYEKDMLTALGERDN